MDTTGATTVYSTSTTGEVSFAELSLDLRAELGISVEERDSFNPFYDESDYYDEWCFVCGRPTDHRAEHDDLVEQGLASYDRTSGIVYSIR